jgi:uncharacterized protein YcbK (DUF882 family)
MLSMDELLNHKYKLEDQTPEIQAHLAILLARVNIIRAKWGKPMTMTSGLRTMADHLRIYAAKGITDPAHIPMKSHHLFGEAVDISDPDLELTDWLKGDGANLLVTTGLWCEEGNANWVHFQIVPPKSGNRWFLP